MAYLHIYSIKIFVFREKNAFRIYRNRKEPPRQNKLIAPLIHLSTFLFVSTRALSQHLSTLQIWIPSEDTHKQHNKGEVEEEFGEVIRSWIRCVFREHPQQSTPDVLASRFYGCGTFRGMEYEARIFSRERHFPGSAAPRRPGLRINHAPSIPFIPSGKKREVYTPSPPSRASCPTPPPSSHRANLEIHSQRLPAEGSACFFPRYRLPV